jgi:hypothetical protein
MLKELNGKGLLIHHWDTDGICSAKLLLEQLSYKDIVNKTPELGNYFLTEKELDEYSNFDFIIVVDMNLPEDNILRLAKNAEIMIFDHHLGNEIKQVFHHNPVIKGKDPNEYPSASWIVNEYLGNDINLFSILGIIGDHEQKIKNNPSFSKIIDGFCEENNLTFEDLHKMVYLLDSNYKLGDKKIVEEAPRLLIEDGTPDFILNNQKWNENYNKLNQEMEKQLNMPEDEIDGIILKKINTPYNIISTLTRQVAWNSGKNTVVINTGFFEDLNQVYVRSKKDCKPIIMRGKELGFKCGGKKEVLGALVPKEKTEAFVDEIIEFLS